MAKIIRNGIDYSPALAVDAVYVDYNNSASGLKAENVQAAIDELQSKEIPIASTTTAGIIKVGTNLSILADGTLSAVDTTDAASITYDNSASHLTAANVKAAIDELVANAYVLPKASATVLGGIKVGANLAIDENGVLSGTGSTAADITYDNSSSSLEATTAQDAIDELAAREVPVATTSAPGIVQVGTNLNITAEGVLSAVDTTDAASLTYSNETSGLEATTVQGAIDELKAGEYVLPEATADTLGGIKVGTNLSIAEGGVLSAVDTTDAASLTYDNATSGLEATTVQGAIDELKAEEYVLPEATTTTLGGVIVGDNLSVDEDGKVSALNIIQKEVIPAAASVENGTIYQYIGESNETYKNGYFYKCANVITEAECTSNDGVTFTSALDQTITVNAKLKHSSGYSRYYTVNINGNSTSYSLNSSSSGKSPRTDLIDIKAGDVVKIAPYIYADVEVKFTYATSVGWEQINVQDAFDLPKASATVLGGVKVGTNLSIDTDGVLSAVDTKDADAISYSNASSGLTSTTVQGAIDELKAEEYVLPAAQASVLGGIKVGENLNVTVDGTLSAVDTTDAASLTYDKTSSGLDATTVQAAIDEVVADALQIDDATASATTVYSSQKVEALVGALPKAMVYKGTLGTDGTITELPAASTANEGFVYLVSTDGTYDGKAAIIGDMFVSNGSAWTLVPSGNDPVLAQSVVYDNTVSGLTATDVKAAIDELVEREYVLPAATTSTLGGVIVGDNLSVDGDGKLSVLNIVQKDTIPAASEDNNGTIYQYIGATNETYKNGYFYKSNGTTWTNVNVQDTFDLPTASATVLGGVKVGTNLSIDTNGVLSAVDTKDADAISYSNTSSGLAATTVQGAIDELKAEEYVLPEATADTLGGIKVGTNLNVTADGTLSAVDTTDAASLTYSNTTSGLEATTVQAAIDELKAEEYVLPEATADTLGGIKVGDGLMATNGILSVDTITGTAVTYDNATSGLKATTVQGAIDELKAEEYVLPTASDTVLGGIKVGANLSIDENGVLSGTGATADDISYDNEASGLTSTTVQDAIDEVYGKTWTGTQAEYDAIETPDPDTTYYITDGGSRTVNINASTVSYDGSTSGIQAANVQDAIDMVKTSNAGKGSSNQPVYFDAEGNATAIAYKFAVMTQEEYDALAVKDPVTLYFIK